MKALMLGAMLVACGGSKPAPNAIPVTDKPLYARLGGKAAIAAVVHELVEKTSSDPRISQYFKTTDRPHLEQQMGEHVCSITGGGCSYTGKNMLAAHAGMALPDIAFEAFMDDLQQTLAKQHVPTRETEEVLAAFHGMKPEVVNH